MQHKSRLKAHHQKMPLWSRCRIELLGRTIIPEEVAQNYVQKHIGFVNYYKNNKPRLSVNTNRHVLALKSRCQNHHL